MLENLGLDLFSDGQSLLGAFFLPYRSVSLASRSRAIQHIVPTHREVLRLAANLPDSAVGLTPVRDHLFHLLFQYWLQYF